MSESNIFIISNNKTKAEDFTKKVVLLRSYDSVGILTKENAIEFLQNKEPDLILLHIEAKEDTAFIQRLRCIKCLANTAIIILTEFDDEEMLCDAFDYGADDFMRIDSEDTELIMRIMWGVKKKIILDVSAKKDDILSRADITDFETGFYNKNFTQKLFEQEYNNIVLNNLTVVFMIVAVDLNCKNKITNKRIAEIIKKVIRANDSCGFTQEGRFYILLYKTTEFGVDCLFKRLNSILPLDVTLSASAIKVGQNTFSDAEYILNKNLGAALIKGNNLIFISNRAEIKPAIKFGIKNEEIILPKNVKNLFIAKMEKMLIPLFFKMQAIYEPKLFNTKISQYIGKSESSFLIQSRSFSSEITIKYENYKKDILINVNEIINGEEFCSKYSFDDKNFSVEAAENIIQTVLEKFRQNLYDSEEELL